MKKTFFLFLVAMLWLMNNQAKAQMPAVATDVSPLLVLEEIPDATLVNAEGNSVSLYSITAEKPTIIVFYRGSWCGNCTRNFNEEYVPNLAEIERLGYNLVAISPDAPESLLQTSEDSGMDPKYFYGDGTGAFTKAMGLAWQQQDRMRDMLLESSGGLNTDLYLAVPAVYVVDTSNTILFAHITPMGIRSANRMKWSLLEPVLIALMSDNM